MQPITAYPKSNPTQLPTPKSNINYYSSLKYGANDCSDDETVIMANKEGANLMDEEGTVQTAFSVWGSDDKSELDKGFGGLDPTHHNINHVNGRENARERPALITIDNKSNFESNVTRGSSERKYLQSDKILCTTGSVARGSSDMKYSLTTKVPGKYPVKRIKKGGKQSKDTLPSYHPLCLQQTTCRHQHRQDNKHGSISSKPKTYESYHRRELYLIMKGSREQSSGHF